MIHAYQEIYLSKAQSMLGDAFDYAVHDCGISGNEFVKMFVASSISKRLENGEPMYLVGKSGMEVVLDIIKDTTGKEVSVEPTVCFERSAEHWIGWAVAYYQWHSDRKYSDIFKAVSFEELRSMYPTLHEADISKFVQIIDQRIREVFLETNLKRMRMIYGCTQAELAQWSGVSLRSIQMYEQRNKDINKASVLTVYRLAKVLGCSVEQLMEK